MTDKPVQYGVSEKSSTVLVSLEDFTPLRGDLLQSLYLVVLGYNLDMSLGEEWTTDPPSQNSKNDDHDTSKRDEKYSKMEQKTITRINNLHAANWKFGMPFNGKLFNFDSTVYTETHGTGSSAKIYSNAAEDFFFAWYSPVILVQRGRQCHFPEGYPLFYGTPKRQTSIYTAVFDIRTEDPKYLLINPKPPKPPVDPKPLTTDKLADAVKAFQSIHCQLSTIYNSEIKRQVLIDERERKINKDYDTVKAAFSMLIKSLETRALDENHQIRYTNVFTFKENDEWLEGGHQNWGDHRMDMTINVQVAD